MYDEEFKKNIVRLVESGQKIATLAKEYGINRNSIYTWKTQYGTIITNDKISKIVKENQKLWEENEILKKL